MSNLLNRKRIVSHPFVLGELAMGSLSDRVSLLQSLDELTQVDVAYDFEVRELIERQKLYSRGISWVDAHLLASTLFDSSILFWTLDKRLARAASDIGVPLHIGTLPN